jgi:hypothetical protein
MTAKQSYWLKIVCCVALLALSWASNERWCSSLNRPWHGWCLIASGLVVIVRPVLLIGLLYLACKLALLIGADNEKSANQP